MGLSPDLFKRLSKLNRKRLHEQLTTGDCLTPEEPTEAGSPDEDPAEAVLEKLIPGTERETALGRFYYVRQPAEEIAAVAGGGRGWFDGSTFFSDYRRTLRGAGRSLTPDEAHPDVCPILDADPARIAYLDIESCGLGGEPLFLVGLLTDRDGRLVVEQFLARDYAEEGPLLEAVWEVVTGLECLVSFNGKSFDLPTIRARSAVAGLFDLPSEPYHLDLLHESRRRWGDATPNCRLQTLEQCICGRHRSGDIAGHQIPAAYHEFVRAHQGDDAIRCGASLRQLRTIVHHNALDLVTMAELLTHILAGTA